MPCSLHPIDELEVAIALSVVQHEGADARGTGPERHDHQVHHGPHVFAMVRRDAQFRPSDRIGKCFGIGLSCLAFRELDPFFHGANGFEVFIHLASIVCVDPAFQAPRLLRHQVEDAPVGHALIGATKHAVIDHAG